MTGEKPLNGAEGPQASPSGETGPPGEREAPAPQLQPEVIAKIARLRSTLRENFGMAVMSLMMVPRYRAQSVSDLQHILLDPMINDRVAMAYRKTPSGPLPADLAGFAIWASVSQEVDQSIREQIKSGVFPVRLKATDWNSGSINWLLDVIAADSKAVTSVISNFRSVAGTGQLRLHPVITRLVDPEVLENMGAQRSPDGPDPSSPET